MGKRSTSDEKPNSGRRGSKGARCEGTRPCGSPNGAGGGRATGLWKSGDWLTLGLDATDELKVSAGEASGGVVPTPSSERRGVKGVAALEKRRVGVGVGVLVGLANSDEKDAGGRI